MGTRFVGSLGAAVVFAACGSVSNQVDGGGTDGGAGDAPPDPAATIHVATTGNDTNDGHAAPVRTLKHALGIAAADPMITRIELAGGKYDASGGETFPYTINTSLVIAGPAGGGAIFTGDGSVPAFTLQSGALVNVELEAFGDAVIATGPVTLTGVRVRGSNVALRGETGSNLTVAMIDITGAAGACATGVELNGGAKLAATGFAARQLGAVAVVKDTTNASFVHLDIAGDPVCKSAMFQVATSGNFEIGDGLIDGGTRGIDFSGATAPTHATLTSTIIRNLTSQALTGRTVVFSMAQGELTHNGRAGLEASGGAWSFDGVKIQQNTVMGIYLQGSGAAAGTLKMRNSTVASNGDGVYLFDNAEADFGKVGDPGNNTFVSNSGQGIDVDGFAGGTLITAVGNTWRPTTQGTDATGKYVRVGTIVGPVDDGSAMNFSINTGWSLQR